MTDERKTNPDQSLVKILNDAAPELRRIAPKYVNVQRLLALAIEAKQRNPMLEKSSLISVLNFCKRCAETGTDRIGAGGMWAVPFWNSKMNCYDMTPIPDWRLLIEKAKKAKAITHATAEVVREGDRFSFARGMRPDLVHEPRLGSTGEVLAAYCVYTLPDGTRDFLIMDRAEILAIRNRSKAWQNYEKDPSKTCPWATDDAEMSKKTVVKRTMKIFEGASIELTALLDTDNVVNGVVDLVPEIREPITMPHAITSGAHVETAPPAEPSQTQQTNNVKSEPTPKTSKPKNDVPPATPSGPSVTGIVEHVSTRSGSTNNKQWTLHGIKVEGQYHNTFDEKLADVAREAKAIERPVIIGYERSAKGGRNLKSIAFAAENMDEAGNEEMPTNGGEANDSD